MFRIIVTFSAVLWTTLACAQSIGPTSLQIRPPGSGGPTINDVSTYTLRGPIVNPRGYRIAQVTNRVGIPNQVSGSNTQGGWRSWQVAYDDISSLQVCMWNGKVLSNAGETGSGGAVTYRIAVEYPPGNFIDLLASGSPNGLLVANNAIGCFDNTNLGTVIPAGQKFRLSGDMNGDANYRMQALGWSNACDKANGDEYQSGSTGYNHYKDTTVLAGGPAQCFLPPLVMAYTNRSVWWLIGDSITAGVNDMGGSPSGGRGLFGRAMAQLGPHLNYGVPGDRASLYANTANSAIRTSLAALGGANSALLSLGINDFYSGSRTTDQVITDRTTITANAKAAIAGLNVFWTSITPITTSTDGWTTTANQTPSNTTNNNSRARFNDFLRNTTSYTATCTETTGNATLTACTGLPVTTIAPGMLVTGTGITGTTTVTAVNIVAGTVTVDVAGNVTGSGAQSLTFAWAATANTWPTNMDGMVDVARAVEGSPNQVQGPVANGGVALPGYLGQTDGTHFNHYGIMMATPQIQSMLPVQR